MGFGMTQNDPHAAVRAKQDNMPPNIRQHNTKRHGTTDKMRYDKRLCSEPLTAPSWQSCGEEKWALSPRLPFSATLPASLAGGGGVGTQGPNKQRRLQSQDQDLVCYRILCQYMGGRHCSAQTTALQTTPCVASIDVCALAVVSTKGRGVHAHLHPHTATDSQC